jgi:hypothetical protein
MTDQIIVKLEDQTGVMAQNGPMRIFIQAWDKKGPDLKSIFVFFSIKIIF